MATYSTAFTIANICLQSRGLVPISNVNAYGDPTQSDKYQLQCTIFLDLCQRAASLTLNKRFNLREFTINTVQGQYDYQLPAAVLVEGFLANSFFNVTDGYGGRMRVVNYDVFRMNHPSPDLFPSCRPYEIIPLPDDGSGVPTVRLFPIPDQAYQINGQCRMIVPQIANGSTQITFPDHYVHALIFATCTMLEMSMNEGRDVGMAQLAQKFADEVFVDAGGAYEEVKPIEPGLKLWGGVSRRRRSRNVWDCEVNNAASGQGSPQGNTGDIQYFSQVNLQANLPIGPTGYYLQVAPSGLPQWAPISGGGASVSISSSASAFLSAASNVISAVNAPINTIPYYSAANMLGLLAAPTADGQYLGRSGGVLTWSTPAGSGGGVSSVGLSLPGGGTLFSVSGSPVTSSGTLVISVGCSAGDVIVGTATNTLGRLPIGAIGTYLGVNSSGQLAFSMPAGGGGNSFADVVSYTFAGGL